MDTGLLIAFLAGVGVVVVVAALTVFLTLYVRKRVSGGGEKPNPPQPPVVERQGEYTIRLSERSTGKEWTRQINGQLLIGRGEDCDVHLSDQSVGRAQCKIVIGKQGLEIVDLGAKNRTKQNGVLVISGSQLNRGDKLRFGRAELLVESIQHLGVEQPGRKSGSATEEIPDEDDTGGWEGSQNPPKKQKRGTIDVFDIVNSGDFQDEN